VLQKVRDFLIRRKLSLSRMLAAYDREQSGLVPTVHFVAAFRSVGWELTARDLNILRESYEDTMTPHFLRWKTLSAHVDVELDDAAPAETEVSPSMRDLLTSTTKQLTASQMHSGSPRQKRPIPGELIPLFSRIAKAVSEFRFDLRGELLAEDRFKNGTISRTAFKHIINLLPLAIPPTQLDTLAAFYCDETTGRAYYESFCNDIKEFGKAPDVRRDEPSEEEPVSRRTVRQSEPIENIPEEVARIIVRLREFTKSRGISLLELFSNVDKRNTGAVSRVNLNKVLSSSIVSVSSADLELLVTYFRDVDVPGQVNYLKLCRAVESEEAVPSPTDIGRVPISQGEEAEVANIVHRLDDVVRGKRYSFTKLFQDQQPGVIPQSVFRHKIEEVAQLRLSGHEWYLLLRKYKANMRGDVDWQQFCEDAHKPIRLF
jgi:Ca2+-binding EF-hand superfamily protein